MVGPHPYVSTTTQQAESLIGSIRALIQQSTNRKYNEAENTTTIDRKYNEAILLIVADCSVLKTTTNSLDLLIL